MTSVGTGDASARMIQSIRVMTVRAALPEPIVFGAWIMPFREYAVVQVRSRDGMTGYAVTLTRDGVVAEQLRKSIAPVYLDTSIDRREETWTLAWRRTLGAHASGVGLRALSIVDLACWDNAARAANRTITSLLGGRDEPMPVTAIIGYPPARMGPDATGAEAARLYAAGWHRFKLPIAATPELTAARLRAVRRAAPDAWIGLDGAWLWDDPRAAAQFVNSLADIRLGWFEDVFPPGDIESLRVLKRATTTPVAMGDEQADAYFPGALIDAGVVDVVRVDATCMGGVTRFRLIADQVQRAGLSLSPHMFGHVHSRLVRGLGLRGVPIEWSFGGTGVDPFADSLEQPTVHDGLMDPLPDEPGFGTLINAAWIRTQDYDDPDGILRDQP